MSKVTIILILGLCFVGCRASQNYENLNRLEVGMSKEQVLQVMGEPQQRYASEDLEQWKYLTNHSRYSRALCESGAYTFLKFKDDSFAEWYHKNEGCAFGRNPMEN